MIPVQKLQANFLLDPIQRCPLKISMRFKGVSEMYANFYAKMNGRTTIMFYSTVPADGLALVGATKYAGRLMVKFVSGLCIEPALKYIYRCKFHYNAMQTRIKLFLYNTMTTIEPSSCLLDCQKDSPELFDYGDFFWKKNFWRGRIRGPLAVSHLEVLKLKLIADWNCLVCNLFIYLILCCYLCANAGCFVVIFLCEVLDIFPQNDALSHIFLIHCHIHIILKFNLFHEKTSLNHFNS